MYTKDVNQRSPLRVFEKSIHGGLGKGNIWIVLSRAGVGKTAFLVGVALDDLMRGRKVLHVSVGDSVEHVREFYDEVFEDLRHSVRMEDAHQTRLLMERSRFIHTYRGTGLSVSKLHKDTAFYREHAHFEPEVVVVDGFDFGTASETDLTALRDYAREFQVELWLSALTHRQDPVTHPRGIPNPIARFEAWICVIVMLEPHEGAVGLALLKDHENRSLEHLQLRLDPRTLLLLEDHK
jgi:hypothetical protein